VILWIESHSTWMIVVLAFGLSYVMAIIIFAVAVAVSRRRIATDLKATSPVMLTPLSVVAGLLIVFLSSHVWSNLDRANAYIAQEASAIRECLILADAFPDDMRTELGRSVKNYLHFVEVQDWPAMNESRASLRPLPSGLTDAVRTLLSFVPAQPGQQLAQQRALVALEQALEARRGRIMLSQTVIAPIQWIVIFTLAALVLPTIAMVHIDRPVTTAINLFIFSSAVAACLALLVVCDRPFAAGGNTVEPAALREISPE
jgi:hypothetical protein